LPDDFTEANRENYLVVQIEDPDVLPHIDAIAAMPGVDVLFVGPGDLAVALGKVGVTDDPGFQGILHAVAAACQRHGKLAGSPCAPDQVAAYRAMGYSFFNVFSDYRGVFNGAKQALAASKA
jgi:2-keto-3-deoxy-L-rhamnonate aldolase RhmA